MRYDLLELCSFGLNLISDCYKTYKFKVLKILNFLILMI